MREVPDVQPSLYTPAQSIPRFVARDSGNPAAALVYWLGMPEPSHEDSFFAAIQKFGPLMQLVLPDERPGVFVNRDAVRAVQNGGVVKRLVFRDQSSLDVRYEGPCSDLCGT